MNLIGNGKIARLPRAIRQRLNLRIREGEKGKTLVAWLNSLPEVQALVHFEYDDKPIREQNLSEWRQAGYRGWLAAVEAREAMTQFADDAESFEGRNRPPITDLLAFWIASRYATASRQLSGSVDPKDWRLLREMCHDIAELRRGDHSAQRIEIERQRVEAITVGAEMRYKRQIVNGLDTLFAWVKKNPQAQAAFDELVRLARHPLDPSGTV